MSKNPTKTNWIRVVLGLLISALFLYLALRKMDLSTVVQEISKVSTFFLIVATLVAYLNLLLKSYRWRYILLPVKRVSLMSVFGFLLIGFTLNNVLPFRVGELGRAILLGERKGFSKSSAVGSVVTERWFDLVGLVVFFPVLLIAVSLPVNTKWYLLSSTVVAFGGIALAYLMVLKRDQTLRIFNYFSNILPDKPRARIRQLFQKFFDGLEILKSKRQIAVLVLLSVLSWFLTMLTVLFLFKAFDLSLPFHVAIITVIAVNIASALPSSPSQIGVAHYAYQKALTLFSVSGETALAFGIVSHALGFLITTIPGSLILFWQSVRKKRHLT